MNENCKLTKITGATDEWLLHARLEGRLVAEYFTVNGLVLKTLWKVHHAKYPRQFMECGRLFYNSGTHRPDGKEII
uniref:Uncharacterized protein n=1 Tax=Serratia phage Kevin TaxID=3161161 RepID=A0AAU8KX51_9CAUD